MRRATFAAALSLGLAFPLLALGVALMSPGVRASIGDFLSPVPLPSAAATRATAAALPPQLAITGAESSELHALVAGDAGAPTDRGPRTALFPRELAPDRDPYERPHGLKRPELASRDDATVDRAMEYLATDAHGHGALLAAIKRSGRHRDEVDRILRAWKIPIELVAIAFVESAFTPTATSLDGGGGLWSLTHEVSQAYGLATLPK
jgi:membrane-bound lytic murein transglycosylase D